MSCGPGCDPKVPTVTVANRSVLGGNHPGKFHRRGSAPHGDLPEALAAGDSQHITCGGPHHAGDFLDGRYCLHAISEPAPDMDGHQSRRGRTVESEVSSIRGPFRIGDGILPLGWFRKDHDLNQVAGGAGGPEGVPSRRRTAPAFCSTPH
jgi:hypothetical protein